MKYGRDIICQKTGFLHFYFPSIATSLVNAGLTLGMVTTSARSCSSARTFSLSYPLGTSSRMWNEILLSGTSCCSAGSLGFVLITSTSSSTATWKSPGMAPSGMLNNVSLTFLLSSLISQRGVDVGGMYGCTRASVHDKERLKFTCHMPTFQFTVYILNRDTTQ